MPTPQATALQLVPGTVACLYVDWLATRSQGYPEANWNYQPNTFAILTMAPQVAKTHLSTLNDFGERQTSGVRGNAEEQKTGRM